MAYTDANWELAVCDLAGNTRSYIQEWSFTIIRRILNYSEVDMQVVPGAQGSSELLIGQRTLKVWRNNTIRFRGRIADPLGRTSSNVDVKAYDAAHNLVGRRMQLDVNGNPPAYTNTDASQVIWDRFYQQSLRSVIRVQSGTLAASVLISPTFNADMVEFQAIQQVASMDGAPWWRVDPLDNNTGMWGTLNTWNGPGTGTNRPGARFEYGAGTLDNLADYRVEYAMPKNRVVARGSGSTDTAPVAVQSDATSQSTYDLWEDVVSAAATVTTQDQVNRLAVTALMPNPPQTWTFMPNPDNAIPSLWDDFDAGDIVWWLVNDYDLDEMHSGIVLEASLKVDQSGVEQLTGLVVQQLT